MDKDKKTVIDRTITGIVKSTKMNNTVIVSITTMTRHPLYKKAVKHTTRFAVHNEGHDIAVGDKVRIIQTKPISKTKHYKIVEKLMK
jgi:small subunit ribosomal protein S17